MTHLNESYGIRLTAEYRAWAGMRDRCRRHPDYVCRGITVDPAWTTYPKFLESMGRRPAGTSLDRIDNDRGYGPTNCRWATPKEQSNNRRPRRSNVDSERVKDLLSTSGLSLRTIATYLGVSHSTINVIARRLTLGN